MTTARTRSQKTERKSRQNLPVGSTQHLQDVCDRVIMIGVLLAVVELGVHDDDQMGLDGQGPHQRPGSYNNLGYESLK